jgi:hypothetical protein
MQSITPQSGSVAGHQTQKKEWSILYTLPSEDLGVITADRFFYSVFKVSEETRNQFLIQMLPREEPSASATEAKCAIEQMRDRTLSLGRS